MPHACLHLRLFGRLCRHHWIDTMSVAEHIGYFLSAGKNIRFGWQERDRTLRDGCIELFRRGQKNCHLSPKDISVEHVRFPSIMFYSSTCKHMLVCSGAARGEHRGMCPLWHVGGRHFLRFLKILQKITFMIFSKWKWPKSEKKIEIVGSLRS